MSVYVYGSFEVYNEEQGKWKDGNLYIRKDDGTLQMGDLIQGTRMVSNAIMGYDGFDYIEEDGTIERYQKNKLLDDIQNLIQQRICAKGEPDNASNVTKERFDNMRKAVVDPSLFPYTPKTVTYTLGDMLYLKATAKLISEPAQIFYNQFFRPIEETLKVVKNVHFVYPNDEVRVVLWAE